MNPSSLLAALLCNPGSYWLAGSVPLAPIGYPAGGQHYSAVLIGRPGEAAEF